MKHIHMFLKKFVPVLLSVCMVLSMTGCGKSSDMILYCSKQDVILTEVTQLSQELQGIINDLNDALGRGDQESYEASLTKLQECGQNLINDYHALANQTPPEEYKEQQKQLKSYADDIERMLSNTVRLYTLAEERILGGMSNDTTEQVAKLMGEIEAQTGAAEAFDAILCEIMGIEASDASSRKNNDKEESSEEETDKDTSSDKKK